MREKRLNFGAAHLQRVPVAFHWKDHHYGIAEILAQWQDHGFGSGEYPRRGRWWQRHHRNYCRVRTEEGEVYELYYDRGTGLHHPEQRRWYLYRRL